MTIDSMSRNTPTALRCLRVRIAELRAEADALEALSDELYNAFGALLPNEKAEDALRLLLTPGARAGAGGETSPVADSADARDADGFGPGAGPAGPPSPKGC